MKEYLFFTNKNGEIVEHRIQAESAMKAYTILKESNYTPIEISIAGYKEGGL